MAEGKSDRNTQRSTIKTRKAPVTMAEIIASTVFILSLVIVVVVIIKCLLMAVYYRREINSPEFGRPNDNSNSHATYSKGDQPCCLPFKFQAVITPLAQFDANSKQIMRVYRDWESRLQAMEQTTFDEHGIVHEAYTKTIYNYKYNTAYRINPVNKKCVSWEINSGMLEPCMPENAQYLGKSYIGFHDNKREFRSFYFRRTDKNRDMEMTIAVTSEECVPVMEHVTGRIGSATADSLVFFSNVTTLQDESIFEAPEFCFRGPDK